MEQFIQPASGDKTKNGTVNLADLLSAKINANGKAKGKNSQSEATGEALDSLMPFLQLLNAQMCRQNNLSDTVVTNSDGEKITAEQAMLLLSGDVSSSELQQAIAKLNNLQSANKSKQENAANNVEEILKKTDLLKTSPSSEEAGTNTDDQAAEVISLFENKFKVRNGSQANEHTLVDNGKVSGRYGETNTEEVKIKVSGKQTYKQDGEKDVFGSFLKNTDASKTDTENKAAADKNQLPEKTGKTENQKANKSTGQELPSGMEKAIQTEKTTFRETQLAENNSVKVIAGTSAVKEVNTANKDFASDEQEKKDHAVSGKPHLSISKVKEQSADSGRDSVAFEENQHAYNKENKIFPEKISEEAAGKGKIEQKVKIVYLDKNSEEVSMNSITGANGGSGVMEKTNEVSADQIINQVASEIKESTAGDGGRVKVTLTPPSLGTLELDIAVRNGKVEVVLIADNKDVQQVLNNNIDQLKVALQTQDLTIERCDVFMQDKREDSNQSLSNQAFFQDRSEKQKEENNSGKGYREPVGSDSVAGNTAGGRRIGTESSTDSISLFV